MRFLDLELMFSEMRPYDELDGFCIWERYESLEAIRVDSSKDPLESEFVTVLWQRGLFRYNCGFRILT